jgi:uncharacterized membrane protein (DUF373 family)
LTLWLEEKMKSLSTRWRLTAEEWSTLTLYQRFESLVAFLLTLLVTFVIAIALYRLMMEIVWGLFLGILNPLEHRVFQSVFGQIMTVLIALEFNHTLRYVVAREQSIIHTKVVLLISLLALARKFIILDLKETSPNQMFALASVTIALGITYWLIRDRDNRVSES